MHQRRRHRVKKDTKKAFALLELLVTLVILGVLFYVAVNVFFKKTKESEKIHQSIAEDGIDTSNYRTIVDSTKKKIEKINTQRLQRQKKIENIEY